MKAADLRRSPDRAPTKGLRKYILYLHALTGGGAERVACVLASALAERGHEVLVAVDSEADDNRPFLSPRVRLLVLGGSHGQTVRRLARLLRAEKPDVAMSLLAAANLKMAAAAAWAGMLNRTILSYHGYAESEPQRLSRIGMGATLVLTRLTARTVCVSDGLLSYLRDRWSGSRAKTMRIFNPVKVGGLETASGDREPAGSEPVILAMGRLVAYKNFGHLLRAFARVEPRDARLVIMGEGPERAALEAEALALGIADRVALPGYAAEPWAAYRTATCFALPSQSESFGLVIVEALAYGLPVVATDCDGPREVLVDRSLGCIVPHGDVDALAQALTQALRDPGPPEPRLRRAADFAVEAAADQYEALFAEVALAASPKRRRRSTPQRQLGIALTTAILLLSLFDLMRVGRVHDEMRSAAALIEREVHRVGWLHL